MFVSEVGSVRSGSVLGIVARRFGLSHGDLMALITMKAVMSRLTPKEKGKLKSARSNMLDRCIEEDSEVEKAWQSLVTPMSTSTL